MPLVSHIDNQSIVVSYRNVFPIAIRNAFPSVSINLLLFGWPIFLSTFLLSFSYLQIPNMSSPKSVSSASAELETDIRQMTQSWAGIPPSPSSCQAIMYSSWTRFVGGLTESKSVEEMRASVLWAPRGIIPDFNPPILERACLSTQEVTTTGRKRTDMNAGRRNKIAAKRPKRQCSSPTSWETDDSSDSDSTSTNTSYEAIEFVKESIKSPGTVSMLTKSLKEKTAKKNPKLVKTESLLAVYDGTEVLSPSMLPSPFSLDSDKGSFMEMTRHYGNKGNGEADKSHE